MRRRNDCAGYDIVVSASTPGAEEIRPWPHTQGWEFDQLTHFGVGNVQVVSRYVEHGMHQSEQISLF